MKSRYENLIVFLLVVSLISTSFFQFELIIYDKNYLEEDYSPHSTDIFIGNYVIPGITGSIDPDHIVKIGVLDDLDRSGKHTENGALLAAKELNEAGGVDINGSQYYVGISARNTDEKNYNLDLTKGVAAAETLITSDDPHFAIGGSRTEALMAYIEVIMDHEIPFIGTGCQTDVFCQNVLDDYNRYKYFFRGMPLNSTALAIEFITYIITLAAYLGAAYSGTVNKTAIIYEDLSWTIPLATALNIYLPLFGLEVVESIPCPIVATTTDMMNFMTQIQNSNAQLIIPIFKSELGILMDIAYESVKPKCLIAGMNVPAQLDSYWDNSQGSCQYEVLIQDTFRTNKTDLTISFWDAYLNEYDKDPYYTGVGAYDSVRLLAHAVDESKSFNPDVIVSELEKINISNPFTGASGNIAFTNSHDLVEGYPYNFALFCQWQLDGLKQVVPSYSSIYPDTIATAPLLIPYWGINNLVGERELPGDFTLVTDAESPDTDGDFNLSWTESDGADSYSLYMSDSYMSYINQDLELISHQSDNAPVAINNLQTGHYYFIVASYNSSGETLSNCISINVERPSPGPFTLTSDADNPDIDGNFSLSWTYSEGADNYSIYKHDEYITDINGTLEVVAYQNATIPFNITETLDGIYYYTCVAINETGSTLSNCIMVNVSFPPPDHDLGVILEVPTAVKIDTSYIINATVQNLGLNDENFVEFFLYLDQAVVQMTTISNLPVGASETIQYEWMPTEYDKYNFTAYAPSVSGEKLLENNQETSIILLYDIDIFDGMFIKHFMPQYGVFTNFTYESIDGRYFGESFGQQYGSMHMAYNWTVDAFTRIMSGGSPFGDGAHTLGWIFTNTSLYDIVPIVVSGEADHNFNVSRELIYDLPGFGPVKVWELEDLTAPGGIVWYEQSTGILLNGTFFHSTLLSNYTFTFIDTNADVNVLLPPEDFSLSSNAGDPDDDGIFDLTWTSASRADNYSVYRSSSYITEINESLTLLASEITDLTWALTGYEDGTYYFIVVAHNNYGDTQSNCIEVNVELPSPPGSFTLSSNAENPDDNGIFDLTWTAASGASNYSVYRYSHYITEINGSLTLLASEITDLTWALAGYEDGTYYFIVVAHNNYGDTLSNCIEVNVELPSPPGDFTLSSNAGEPDDNGIFDLTWTAASGASNYSVYRYSSYITEINGSMILLANDITTTSFSLSNYEDGTYYFVVVAHNNFGDTLSNCISVRVLKIIVSGYDLMVILSAAALSLFILTKRKLYKNFN